ncbi:MAG TPA: glycosyltransferase family 4 protein [Thermoanaerobaculia bacterium]|nr:glycosyltransferase family 4 protein [Thermoanaerobaculia bacterium]
MRLLICTPTASLQGGVERIVESLALQLPSRGIEVRFALARGARFHDPDRFRAAYPAIQGFDVDGRSGTSYGRRRALRRVIERFDPDVVLIARMFDAYPVCSELKLRGHRLRLTLTMQAYESDYFVDLQRYAAFVDACVTSGNFMSTAVRRFTDLPADRVHSIPGGVAAPRRSRVPRSGPLRLGYVGRLEQVQKRAYDLIPFVEELERRGIDYTLDIAGDGSALPDLRAKLPRARFYGWIATDALYERIYPELDVLVHFAEWEGLPIAPREAMAHGVVPVSSRYIGDIDFVDGENALTFPVGGIAAAVDAIERLHRDRALLAKLSRAARASQTGVRSEQGAIDAWAEVFRDAVSRESRVGDALPFVGRDPGLLTRLQVPEPVAEIVRALRKRKHGDPGSEWPHWSGIANEELADAVMRFSRP